jgi:hypothetical protein
MPCVEVRRVMILDPKKVDNTTAKQVIRAFDVLCRRAIGPIYDDVKKQDRHNFDDVFFDILSLTQGEREAVYEAVINLVEARLKKAGSV